MKTVKTLLVAGLALAASFAAHAESAAQAWLETYYVNPRPAELPTHLRALSREGYLDQPGRSAIAVGFLATVFTQNPTQVDRWLAELNDLPAKTQRLLIAALWQADHPLAAGMLRAAGQSSPVREQIIRLSNTPAQPIADTPVLSPSSMNLQWGAFLASGEERHVLRIFSALGQGEQRLDQAARVALAQHAATHPRVLEICRAQLDRQPAEVRGVLRAALQDVEHRPRT